MANDRPINYTKCLEEISGVINKHVEAKKISYSDIISILECIKCEIIMQLYFQSKQIDEQLNKKNG